MIKHQATIPFLRLIDITKVLSSLNLIYKVLCFLLLCSSITSAQSFSSLQQEQIKENAGSFVTYEQKSVTKGNKPNQVLLIGNPQGASYIQDATQIEDFAMWGVIQKNNPWERFINIVLSFMFLYMIAYSLNQFLSLKKMRKEFQEQVKALLKSHFYKK